MGHKASRHVPKIFRAFWEYSLSYIGRYLPNATIDIVVYYARVASKKDDKETIMLHQLLSDLEINTFGANYVL